MAKGDDIEERLERFAAEVLELCDRLPKNSQGALISGQLMRCATACGANYAEARVAESRIDFIHKIGIALKELKESKYWLRLVIRRYIPGPPKAQTLFNEAVELSRILTVSRRTAAKNAGRIKGDESKC